MRKRQPWDSARVGLPQETKALAKLESSAKAETATPADRQRLDALRERIRIASERQTVAAPSDDRA